MLIATIQWKFENNLTLPKRFLFREQIWCTWDNGAYGVHIKSNLSISDSTLFTYLRKAPPPTRA
jgi:hypothetical protein